MYCEYRMVLRTASLILDMDKAPVIALVSLSSPSRLAVLQSPQRKDHKLNVLTIKKQLCSMTILVLDSATNDNFYANSFSLSNLLSLFFSN